MISHKTMLVTPHQEVVVVIVLYVLQCDCSSELVYSSAAVAIIQLPLLLYTVIRGVCTLRSTIPIRCVPEQP